MKSFAARGDTPGAVDEEEKNRQQQSSWRPIDNRRALAEKMHSTASYEVQSSQPKGKYVGMMRSSRRSKDEIMSIEENIRIQETILRYKIRQLKQIEKMERLEKKMEKQQ